MTRGGGRGSGAVARGGRGRGRARGRKVRGSPFQCVNVSMEDAWSLIAGLDVSEPVKCYTTRRRLVEHFFGVGKV